MLCALMVGDLRKLHGSLNRKRRLFPLPITLRSAERQGNSTQTHTLGIRKLSPAFLSISSIQAYRLKKRNRCNPGCGVTPYFCRKHPYGALVERFHPFFRTCHCEASARSHWLWQSVTPKLPLRRGKSPTRCQWQKMRGDFEEVPANRQARRWAGWHEAPEESLPPHPLNPSVGGPSRTPAGEAEPRPYAPRTAV